MAKRKANTNKTNGKVLHAPPSSNNATTNAFILKAISFASTLIVFAAIYLADQRAQQADTRVYFDPTVSVDQGSSQSSSSAQRREQSSNDGLERITVPTQDGQIEFIDPVKFGTLWEMNQYFSKDYDFKVSGVYD
jgi:hypothetical protein